MILVDGDRASNEQMKAEAISRMKKLNMLSDTIKKFENGKLQMSENGVLVDAPKEIQDFAEEHGNEFAEVIYHVIHSYSNLGETYEYLFVSGYLEDWNFERNNLNRNIIFAYVDNKTSPEDSEAGSIMVENNYGSLVRVG